MSHTFDRVYVQMARGVVFSGIALTLVDLAPATLFITGGQEVGYVPTVIFLDRWYAERAGHQVRSAAAVLSLLDAERAAARDVRLELELPQIRGAGVEYQVADTVDELPHSAGACVLFISPRRTPRTPHLCSA
jgi:hypothetical protein